MEKGRPQKYLEEYIEKETLIEWYLSQSGYRVGNDGTKIYRRNGTIAASYNPHTRKWETCPLPEEFARYTLECGRGFPSFGLKKDLTNPGAP